MTLHAVTGARAHRDLASVWRALSALPAGIGLVSGGAEGPDTVAAIVALQQGRELREHLPDYAAHGRGAPFVRNKLIVDAGEVVHGFPWGESRGTRHAMGLARDAGKAVLVYDPPADLVPGPCLVFSARRRGGRGLGYDGPGARHGCALDVTRMTGGAAGDPFAPSWAILKPALDARREADALMARAKRAVHAPLDAADREDEWALTQEAEALDLAAWEAYRPAFLAEMRLSYRRRRKAWDELLARSMVVLLCFCEDESHCHRTLLRRDILPKLGAVDGGEIPWMNDRGARRIAERSAPSTAADPAADHGAGGDGR